MLRETDSFFGRFEVAGKSAHDLDVHDATGVFTVAKMQLGYSAHFAAWRRLAAGFGGAVSVGFVPRSLSATYGRRVNPGLGLFLTLRPRAHRMSH